MSSIDWGLRGLSGLTTQRIRIASWQLYPSSPQDVSEEETSKIFFFLVEMQNKCMECMKWNEHWYWNHLEHTRIRFSCLLTAGFHQRLVIPRKIVSMFRKQLVNTATLKSLTGKSWITGLEKRDGELFFQQGWADFVRAYSLNEGDILIFQYERDSTFAFSVFDSKTGYEKVGSCFNHGLPSNLETMEPNFHVESMNNSSNDANILQSGPSENRTVKIETESEDYTPPRKKARKVPSTSSKGKSVCKEPNSRDTGNRRIKPYKTYPIQFVSQRRHVTEAEKEKAHQLASAFQSKKPSFIVTMAATSVCRKFFMSIPQSFMREHVSRSVKEVVLCVPPSVKTWVVTLATIKKNPYQHGFSRGWMSFVWDNNLELGDICVFELTQLGGNKNRKTIAVNVKIFRVREKLTQLTKAGRSIPPQETGV